MRAAVARFGEVLIRFDDGSDRVPDLESALGAAVALLDEAWAAGRAVGLAERVPPYVFVDAELAWRVIRRGDAIVGDDDLIYTVVRSGWNEHPRAPGEPGCWGLTLASGTYREQFTGDPDEQARVLLRAGLVDAVRLTREALEARVITTRRNADGTYDGDLLWRGEATS
jgi:hypothetical protein